MSKWILKDTDGTVVASAETQSFTYDFTQSHGGYVIEYEDENGCAATPLTAGTECLEYTCETMISDYNIDTVYVKSLHIHAAMVAMQGDTKIYDNSFIPNSSLISGIDISANYITDKIVDKLVYDTENHYFYLTEPVEHGITFYNDEQEAEINVEFETSHNNWTFDYSNDFECNYDSASLTITKHIYPYRLLFGFDFGLSKEIGGEIYTEAENRMCIGVDRKQLTHEYSLLAHEDEHTIILHDFKADSLDAFNDMISRQFRGFNIPNEETWKNGFTLDIYAKSKGVFWANEEHQVSCFSDDFITSDRVTISSNKETCSVINIKLIPCQIHNNNFVSIETYTVGTKDI